MFHLAVSLIQALSKLIKLLIHSEGEDVVPEGAESFDHILVVGLLDQLMLLELQRYLTSGRANSCRRTRVSNLQKLMHIIEHCHC